MSWHSYNFNTCNTESCWTSEVAPVLAQVPVIVGEMGENDCGGSYIDSLTSWLQLGEHQLPGLDLGRLGQLP